jgi:hypothetical protein
MKSKPNPRPTDEERLLFEEFWRAYPSGKKGRKDRAQRAFVAAVRRGTEVSDDRPGGFTAAENFEVIMRRSSRRSGGWKRGRPPSILRRRSTRTTRTR